MKLKSSMIPLLIALMSWLTVACQLSSAQDAKTDGAESQLASASQPPVTLEQIDSRLKELESATDLEETVLASAKDLYLKAKQHLQAAATFQSQTKSFDEKTVAAPETLKTTREQLDQNATEQDSLKIPSELSQIQADLAQKSTELATARTTLTELEAEPSRRQARLLELPGLMAKAEQNLTAITQQSAQPPPSDESPFTTQSRQANLQAQQQSLTHEVAAYKAEQAYYAATSELLPLQTEWQRRTIERLQAETAKLKSVVEKERVNDIAKLEKRTASELLASPELLKPAAQLNVDLVAQYVEVASQLDDSFTKLEAAQKTLENIKSEYKLSRERVDAVGLNGTLGIMLRRNKQWLSRQRRSFESDGTLQTTISDLQVDSFRLQDLSKNASETDAAVTVLFDELDIARSNRKALQAAAKRILANRREILTPFMQAQTELFNRLVALDTERRQAILAINDYTRYINQHVLWIRSGATFGRDDLESFDGAIRWMFAPTNWSDLGTAFVTGARAMPILSAMLALGILALSVMQRRLRLAIRTAAEAAEARVCRVFLPTFVALCDTILIAAFWPFAAIAMGIILRNAAGNSVVNASAMALITTGLTIFPFELLRQTCRNQGLGESHFGWPDTSRSFLRSNLRWLIPVLATMLFIVSLMQHQPTEEFRSSVGRLVMVLMLFVTGVYTYVVLHPNSQLYRGMARQSHDTFVYRFRIVRFAIAMLIISSLLLFTFGGYYYTTYQLGSRLLKTNALVIMFAITFQVGMRWLLVRRRRMKLEQLAERRDEAERQPHLDQSVSESVKVELHSEQGLDADSVNKQAKELLLVVMVAIGLSIAWRIWDDTFPAVGILDRVKLWTVSVSGVNEKVTLQHLLFSVLTVAGTVLAVKNVPGILELLLLRRLPIDAGARYAVATIFRYLIGLLGMIIAFAFLKVQWSQFSWLVAAISVGLGFGLQEIVANFVSGLILLLERPVRIGDIVTIEGTTGVVSKIQMRATTVTNWDQQELVVPNKNLITSSIFNWTLSNVLTRITLEVGVAYGSDVEFVTELIMDALNANDEVINDPPPSVTFQTFGDSSLNFTARCCISGPDRRLATIHALQVAISKRLAENNIEIPFPQRVVHLIDESEATDANDP